MADLENFVPVDTHPVTGKDLRGMSWVERCTSLYYYARRDRAEEHRGERDTEALYFAAMAAWNAAVNESQHHYSRGTASMVSLITHGAMESQSSWLTPSDT